MWRNLYGVNTVFALLPALFGCRTSPAISGAAASTVTSPTSLPDSSLAPTIDAPNPLNEDDEIAPQTVASQSQCVAAAAGSHARFGRFLVAQTAAGKNFTEQAKLHGPEWMRDQMLDLCVTMAWSVEVAACHAGDTDNLAECRDSMTQVQYEALKVRVDRVMTMSYAGRTR
jgi:hypothetical protein